MPYKTLSILAVLALMITGCHDQAALHKHDMETHEPRVVEIPGTDEQVLDLAAREAENGDYGVALVLAHQVLKDDPNNNRARRLIDKWRLESGFTVLYREGPQGEVYPDWYLEAVERANRRFQDADMDDSANPFPQGTP